MRLYFPGFLCIIFGLAWSLNSSAQTVSDIARAAYVDAEAALKFSQYDRAEELAEKAIAYLEAPNPRILSVILRARYFRQDYIGATATAEHFISLEPSSELYEEFAPIIEDTARMLNAEIAGNARFALVKNIRLQKWGQLFTNRGPSFTLFQSQDAGRNDWAHRILEIGTNGQVINDSTVSYKRRLALNDVGGDGQGGVLGIASDKNKRIIAKYSAKKGYDWKQSYEGLEIHWNYSKVFGLKDGSFLVIGPDSKNKRLTMVAKLDAKGKTLWSQHLSHPDGISSTTYRDIAEDAGGNILLAGILTNPKKSPTSREKPIIRLLDSAGGTRWNIILNLNTGHSISDAVANDDGSFAIRFFGRLTIEGLKFDRARSGFALISPEGEILKEHRLDAPIVLPMNTEVSGLKPLPSGGYVGVWKAMGIESPSTGLRDHRSALIVLDEDFQFTEWFPFGGGHFKPNELVLNPDNTIAVSGSTEEMNSNGYRSAPNIYLFRIKPE
ncbi:hypothetical protein GCM10009069_29600 [Algimonas arctica]|uniref:Tetratricopeptide repeat protein n=1 Tax=Algimonas arctica TaxID=1479486 RepID=A0A8J3CSY1_9PROT|nr:hypothetical protein [Algimonas arctica]GHB05162.1 hypothetical protein GCM10009069_29600 [Algimonas arctica]